MNRPVGIIVNPSSGKDIRRLVASGTVIGNHEKANIVVRLLIALDRLGTERVLLLEDGAGICRRALHELHEPLARLEVEMLRLPYLLGNGEDSLRGAAEMVQTGCGCLIVLGGDGTSRVVAKASAGVPMIALSTGTNNVFPKMIEGTLAGMAAALVVGGAVEADAACDLAPVLDLLDGEGKVFDQALVDVAVVDAAQVAARAVWDAKSIREVYLTTARPDAIGISSIGGLFDPLPEDAGEGLMLRLGNRGKRVLVPLAPGLFATVQVSTSSRMQPGKPVTVRFAPSVLALDGEREHVLRAGERVSVRYNPAGPRVVNVQRTLALAVEAGALQGSRIPTPKDTRAN